MQGSGRQVVLAAKCHEAGKTVKLVTWKWRVSGSQADSRGHGQLFKNSLAP